MWRAEMQLSHQGVCEEVMFGFELSGSDWAISVIVGIVVKGSHWSIF